MFTTPPTDSDIATIAAHLEEDFAIETSDDVCAILTSTLAHSSPELCEQLSPLLIWRLQEPCEVLLTVDSPTSQRLASTSTHIAEFRPTDQADVAVTVRHALSVMLTTLDGLLGGTPASKP